MSKDTKSLIEEIYATTVDPARYNEFMRRWESYINDQVTTIDARSGGRARDEHVERHIETALKIFDRIGRHRPNRKSLKAFLAGLPVAAMIVDEHLVIVAANQGAKPLLQFAAPPRLDELALDKLSASKLCSWMAGPATNAEQTLLLPCFLGPEAEASCITATQIDLHHLLADAEGDLDAQNHTYFLLTTVDFHFDQDLGRALCQAYCLSPAEAAVGMALAEGVSPGKIASRRDVSLNTVRTQIKAILRKLDASAIPDLVRIISGFKASISASRSLVDGNMTKRDVKRHQREAMLKLRDGRRLAYQESGSIEGRPILFVHNMLLGPNLTESAIAMAERKGWRLIAPSRPGFGHSDSPAHASNTAVLDVFVRDVEELLDHLGIRQVTLIGHLSGGVQALRIAEQLPGHIGALLLLNYVPHYDACRLLALPAWQRAFGLTIHYAPHLLPFIARAGAAYIDAGCEDQLLRTLHGGIPADMAALARLEVRSLAIEGLRHTVQQGPAAFCNDCPLVISDWRDQARRIKSPTHLLLGADDRFIRPDYGRDFIKSHPNFDLTIVENAGMYLLYTHWPTVFEVLEDLTPKS
ncbi:MAG: alpha/beta fold hydrolase [Geminicoccaceae bacterium]